MSAMLIEDQLHKLLLDGVEEALGRSKKFASPLEDLRFTLLSLQQRIFHRRVEHDVEVHFPKDIQKQMEEGVKLVAKLSSAGMWDYHCMKKRSYSDQLNDLYKSLRRGLHTLKLQEQRDTNQLLLVVRNIRERQILLRGRLSNLVNQLPQKPINDYDDDNNKGNQNEDNGGGKRAGRYLEHVLGRLLEVLVFEVDVEVNGKRGFKHVLEDLKLTVSNFQPLMEEISEYNNVLQLPKEELENLRKQLEKGIELVDMCSKLRREAASYKRLEYFDQLLELDEYLRRLLCMMRMQITNELKETLVSVCNLELMCTRIEELGLAQN